MPSEYGGWRGESSWTLDSLITKWLSAGRVQRRMFRELSLSRTTAVRRRVKVLG